MKVIYKQVLEIKSSQEIEIPRYSTILTVQCQNGNLCLWYLCSPKEEKEKIKIYIFGTGHPIDNYTLIYINTVLSTHCALVLHIFRE